MATGQLPFRGDSSATIFEAILNRAPVAPVRLNPELPAELERIIGKALEKDRNLRYQSPADLRTDLQRLKRDTDSGRSAAASAAPQEQPIQPITNEKQPAALATPSVVAGHRRSATWKSIAPISALLVVLVAAGVYWRSHGTKLTEKDTILLADFINTTGDPVFDGTLKQALAVQLQQSPFLYILPDSRVRETLQLMGHPADEHVTGQVARELCERESIKAALNGSISALGTQYVISLDAVNCHSGDSLTRDQVTASSKEKVLSALSEAATRLRSNLGESLASIQKFDRPIQEATTTSLEALKAYSQASELNDRGRDLEAIPLYERAIQLDPNFASGYGGLATVYANGSEEERSIEYMKKAYALRDRVSDRERFELNANYHWIVTGDLDKEIANDELAHQSYPRDDRSTNDLAVNYCLWQGQFEKGLQLARETLRLNPHGRGSHAALTCGYLGLNRPDEARTVLEDAVKNDPENSNIRFSLYWVYTALGDAAGVERQVQWASGKFTGAGIVQVASANAAAYGRIQKARGLSGQAQEILRTNNFKESEAAAVASQALIEAQVGDFAEARKGAAISQALARTRANLSTVALTLAFATDWNAAGKLVDDLKRRYPADFQVNGVVAPCAESLIRSGHGNTEAALQVLQPTVRYELGPAFGFTPLYIRGLIYLRARQGKEAAAEFQKILEYRFLGAPFPLYVLSHLGLARSWSMAGDTAKARTEYQNFLALWKDADPTSPS
jgi:tetratricopeptide (TPR) repeat protein